MYIHILILTLHVNVTTNSPQFLQKIRSGFHQHFNIPSSGQICLLMPPMNLVFGNWYEDERGRFSVEKEIWNEFARKAGFRVGSIIILCVIRFNCDIHMYFEPLCEVVLICSRSGRLRSRARCDQ